MEKLRVKVLEVNQPIQKFYVGVMDYRDVIRLSTTNMNEIKNNNEDVYQRQLDEKRLPSLKRYMEYSRASFPNGILLNSKVPLEYENGYLLVPDDNNTFFIIDGQHRIEALKYYNKKEPFDVCVVIFNNLNVDLQTELFVTVNNEQKKVNPNIRMNLKGNDEIDSPDKIARNIVIALNKDSKSPFKKLIKLDDKKESKGIISLYTIAIPIIEYIYNSQDYYIVKDALIKNKNNKECLRNIYDKDNKVKRIFWDFYLENEEATLYAILVNYFSAIKDIFPHDWGNPNSLLCKTTGYNALMLLFKDVFIDLKPNLSYDNIYNYLYSIRHMRGSFTLDKMGVGKAASSKLYNELKKHIKNKSEYQLDYQMLSLFDETED